MKKNKILYIGNFSFPDGNASGKRVYANGKTLRELGYEVLFLGMDSEIDNTVSLKETKNSYDGFEFYNISYPKSNTEWLNFFKTFKKIIKFFNEEKISEELNSIIFYGSLRLSILNYLILKWAQKRKIKTIVDCVDWLSVKTDNKLFDFVKWTDTTYHKVFFNKKVDAIICISEYLQNYYKRFVRKTIIIPPLSPFRDEKLKNKNGEKIKIIYAGLPFRKGKKIKNPEILKDRIDLIIDLLLKLKNKEIDFEFNIYGFNKDEYLEVLPQQAEKIKELESFIYFHGHQSNNFVVEELKKSDFTILLRDVKRDTMAGFPTKISESISYGVPVIINNTSDLKKYIINGVNGYMVESEEDLENLANDILNRKDKLKVDSNLFYYKNQVYLDELKKLWN